MVRSGPGDMPAYTDGAAPGALLRLTLNGDEVQVRLADARRSLLDLLREDLGLTGAKLGCNQGGCGACTVIVGGSRVLSCLTLATKVDGSNVTTIEGVATSDNLHALQQAFLEYDGFQCGFCTPGQICSALAMADEHTHGLPSRVSADLVADRSPWNRAEVQERMSGNVCRCGAYNGIVAAIMETLDPRTPSADDPDVSRHHEPLR